MKRNEQFAQNYTPSKFRMALCGKGNDLDFCYRLETKEKWVEKFNEIINDLEKGEEINGCFNKNLVDYWKKQIQLVNEFERKY